MTMKSKLSAFPSTHGKASALMTCTRGESSDLWLSFVNMGLEEKILVISGSRSTTVMLSTSGYFRISRTARPSPPPRIRTRRGAGTAERFMIAVFIAGAELQMAIEKETEVVLEARENEMLIMRVAGKNDLIGVDIVFRGCGDLFCFGHSRAQGAQDHQTGNPQTARGGKLIDEKESTPERHARIDQAEQHRGAHQPEARHQQDRKQQRSP